MRKQETSGLPLVHPDSDSSENDPDAVVTSCSDLLFVGEQEITGGARSSEELIWSLVVFIVCSGVRYRSAPGFIGSLLTLSFSPGPWFIKTCQEVFLSSCCHKKGNRNRKQICLRLGGTASPVKMSNRRQLSHFFWRFYFSTQHISTAEILSAPNKTLQFIWA